GAGPGYRLMLRAGWAGAGLGPAGNGRRLPVPTELKRDRAGLGWGRRGRPRVTHFGPGDAAAVAGPPKTPRGDRGGAGGKRGRVQGRVQGRFRSEEEARGWEIRLREYMERWDPPESPPR
ncbi:GPAN1 protein, partial [Zosterops hypoxanthus]|nr:GPAN1 protein [Zosterops hypoxanthus]